MRRYLISVPMAMSGGRDYHETPSPYVLISFSVTNMWNRTGNILCWE